MKNTSKPNSKLLLYSRPLSDAAIDAELFIDREDELNVAVQGIQNEYNILVVGSRGSGKTSFLYRLKALLEDSQILLTFCDTSSSVTDIDDFLDMLLYSIGNSIAKFMKQDMSEKVKNALSDLSTQISISILGSSFSSLNLKKEREIEWTETKYKVIQKFTEVVRDVSKKGTRIVFFIDNLALKPDFFVEVFGRYRDFLWQLKCNFVVTCDQEFMPYIWKPSVSSFFDIRVSLMPMPESMLKQLLSVRGFKKQKVIHDIYLLSRGSPRIALTIARSLMIGQTNEDDIIRAVATLNRMTNELTPSEQLVLEQILLRGLVSASDREFQQATHQERPRLVQILRKLKQQGWFNTEQKGRAVFYYLNPDIYPMWKDTRYEP